MAGHLRDALTYIDANDHGTWSDVGHALKTLGEPGRALWLEWSATSRKYDHEYAQKTWASFKPERTDHRAVFAKAMRLGWPNPAARADDAQERRSEDELAQAFAQENQTGLRYCAAWAKWLTWDQVKWSIDETLLAIDHARNLCRRAAAASGNERVAVILGKGNTISAVVALARADRRLAATSDQWDADTWLLNTPGGVVDLRTGEVRPCDPALHMTKVTGTAAGGDCPTWLRFLDRITGGDAELQAYLQRVFGYALTGDTSAHALFFFYGTGANGKSVAINTAAGVLGDYHKTAPIETFTESKNERHSTELAMLRGARLVTAAETEQDRHWAETKIKSLTGGDRISARFLYRDNFEFTPCFKLIVAGNHKPGLRTVDEAMRRRIHMIPFDVTIPPEERDPELTAKLREEWPGILKWMIDGCQEWQRVGLAPPAAVRAATEAYLVGEDALSAWMEEMCERDPQAWEPSGALFASWKGWAEARGEQGGNNRRLTQALEARGFAQSRTSQARGVAGLRLKKGLEFEERRSA
jgi:putative DNA primase/helicase